MVDFEMKRYIFGRKLFIMLIPITGLVILMLKQSYAGPLGDLQVSLPEQIDEWKTTREGDRSFDRETIFDYIDGEGEVYRAYNMQRCLSRSYINQEGPKIVMDLFDMGFSKEAFGVFTHDLDGEPVNIGQGGLYEYGWLRFWKDRFFVSIYTDEETPPAEKAVRKLGHIVASLIPQKGPLPGILSKLPPDGLQPGRTRYLHHNDILNYHYYLFDDNILGLGPGRDAVLAKYRRGEQRAVLFLVSYPEAGEAEKALKAFFQYYIPEAEKEGVAPLEDGKWSAAVARDRILAIVLESDNKALAEKLLQEIRF